jgi:hypothetical protein
MGGRGHKSGADAVMTLIPDIETAKRRKNITSRLFIDLKAGFDNLSNACLLQTMAKCGLPQGIINWANNVMTDRFTKLSFGRQSDSLRAINTGITQGSPASPILPLIYLKPLFDVTNEHHPNIEYPSYIVDIGLSESGKSQKRNAEHLNQVATVVFNWADNNGIIFDDPKTELIHFDKSRNPNTENNFMTLPTSNIIHSTSTVRWLGIYCLFVIILYSAT